MERNTLSIRHVIVFAEFCEFDCQDGRLKRWILLWNLSENILKFSRNLSCEILLYISTMICQNRNSFLYCLNAIKYTEYLRKKVTGSVTYTVKTGTLYCPTVYLIPQNPWDSQMSPRLSSCIRWYGSRAWWMSYVAAWRFLDTTRFLYAGYCTGTASTGGVVG